MIYLNRTVKHVIHVLLFSVHFFLFLELTGFMDPNINRDPIGTYGLTTTIILYSLKLFTLVGLPISLCNAAGILYYDVFPKQASLRRAPLLDPFISIRVVTRGLYPELVKQNVMSNLRMCEEFGLDKFVIEVVTDNEINLQRNLRVREIVVPAEYETKTGAKFKARALQYALEDGVNILNDDDWIVHLDEETLLTRSSIVGILNFLYENRHQIGQGLITYGKGEIVNWITTLADSIRVASDLGSLRFSLKTFHKPLYSFKGSFIVCQASVERFVSFDNGIEGSIAEDSYFAIKAVNLGYTFDWIEGEMWEKSPFSFWDFVKQRKRWVQGLFLLVHDTKLKTNFSKLGFTYSLYNWIICPIQFVISFVIMLYPISFSSIDDFLSRLNGIIFSYLFILGAVKSLNFNRRSLFKNFICILGALASITFVMGSESLAIIWGLLSDKRQFFIVKKNDLIFSV